MPQSIQTEAFREKRSLVSNCHDSSSLGPDDSPSNGSKCNRMFACAMAKRRRKGLETARKRSKSKRRAASLTRLHHRIGTGGKGGEVFAGARGGSGPEAGARAGGPGGSGGRGFGTAGAGFGAIAKRRVIRRFTNVQ